MEFFSQTQPLNICYQNFNIFPTSLMLKGFFLDTVSLGNKKVCVHIEAIYQILE